MLCFQDRPQMDPVKASPQKYDINYTTIRNFFPSDYIVFLKEMEQTKSQKFFLWGILIIVGIMVLMWTLRRRCIFCSNKCWQCDEEEGFMPYRDNCPSLSGMGNLDDYSLTNYFSKRGNKALTWGQDYYRSNPHIYPTPDSFNTALYRIKNKYGHMVHNMEEML